MTTSRLSSWLIALISLLLATHALRLGAQTTVITGNYINSGSFYLGIHSGSPSGLVLTYDDVAADAVKLHANRVATWLWENYDGTTNWPSMRLDQSNNLILYNGTNEGVKLNPVSKSLTLGGSSGAILSASGTTFSTNGPFTVGGAFTNTNGIFTGGAAGLTLNAGGANQNINLLPSGTGKVGVGTTSPVATLDVTSAATGDVEIARFINPNIGVGNYGYINVGGTDAQFSGAFLGFQKTGTGTGFATLGVRGVAAALSINQVGNVGIGTTTPSYTLSFGSTLGKAFALFENPGGLNMYGFSAAGTGTGTDPYRVRMFANGSEWMSLTASGNFGIGTTAPNASLDIWKSYSAGTDSLRFSFNDGSAYWMGIQPYVVAAANVGYRFRTNNVNTTVDALAITGSGNVGMGILNPAVKLEVTSSQPYTEYLSGNAPSLYFGATPNVMPNSSANTAAGFIGFSTAAGSYGQNFGDLNIATQSRAPGNSNAINFLVPSDDSGNYQLAAKITRSGNVGIGAASPKAKFSVGFNNDDELNLYSIGDNQMAIQTSLDGQPIGTYGGANNQLFLQPVAGNVLLATGGGNVGVGTSTPTQKLSVAGTVRAYEVIVDTGWSDYVFDESYKLKSLSETEAYIKTEKHLPGIPSAKDVADHGVSIGEMQSKLLAKVEELTLHLIEQEKQLAAQSSRIDQLERDNAALRNGANP